MDSLLRDRVQDCTDAWAAIDAVGGDRLAGALARIPDYKINKVEVMLLWRWNG